jgi:pimeloyl-ACP methyl ester carboxylesterase
MPTIQSAGATIHYRDEGHGSPVLLLHAFPLESRQYQPQLDALSRKYRFIVPDHRGFGKSSLPKNGAATEMEQIADDAIAILDALAIDEAVIGGTSMGGYATMALLRKHRRRARALVLIDTQLGADDPAGKAKREEMARSTLERGVDDLVEAFAPRLLAPSPSAEVKAKVEALIRGNTREGCAAGLRGLALRTDSRDILAAYDGPALVVVGAEDQITPVAKAEEIARAVRGSKLVLIPSAGHLSNLEAPAAFNRALDDFLSTIAKG